jgi:TolB protein
LAWTQTLSRFCVVLFLLLIALIPLVMFAGRFTASDQIAFMSDRAGSWDIYTLDVQHGVVQRLTDHPHDERYPRYAPDGETIAYHADLDIAFDVYFMNPDGTNKRLLPVSADLDPSVSEGMVAWSPDSDRLIFQRDAGPGTNFSLYTSDLTGSATLLIDLGEWDVVYPNWSPDGSRVIYADIDDARWMIQVVDPHNPAQPQILLRDFAVNIYPVYSPDGRYIAYVSNRDNGAEDIYVMNADGTNPRNLTGTTRIVETEPAWTSDSRSIVFASGRDGDFNLYMIDLESGNLRRLTNLPGNEQAPSWRPSE